MLSGEETDPNENGDAAGAAGAAVGAGAAVPKENRLTACAGCADGLAASVLLLGGEDPKENDAAGAAAVAVDAVVPKENVGAAAGAASAAAAGAPNNPPAAGAGAAVVPKEKPGAAAGAAGAAVGAGAAVPKENGFTACAGCADGLAASVLLLGGEDPKENDAAGAAGVAADAVVPKENVGAGAGAGAGAVAAADTGVVPKENTLAACAGFEDSCAASVLFFDGEDPKENGDAAGAGAVFDDGAPNKLPDVTGAVTPNENGLAACTGFEGGCASSDVFEGADWGEARENVTWLAGVVDAGAGAAPKTEALPKRDEPTFAFWLPRPLRPPPKMKRPVAGVSDAVRRCKSERFTI